MNNHMVNLIAQFDQAVADYQSYHGDDVVFDALGALAFFAGTILAQAPDHESQVTAHRFFLQMLNDGLQQNRVTKH